MTGAKYILGIFKFLNVNAFLIKTMEGTFVRALEWHLMTPLEWAASGFEIRLTENPDGRRTDSEIEDLIEENWENRQADRTRKGIFVEEPWPKTGYRAHHLNLDERVIEVMVSPADWKSMQGTHYNPEFFELMLKRFNERSQKKLSLPSAHENTMFQSFIAPYLDGALSQCSVIYTGRGIPIGFRSDEVGVADNIWHVPGGYLPGPGEGIYKSEVPILEGTPIVEKKVFTLDVESMRANAGVNLFKESGGLLPPGKAKIEYIGVIYELPNHGVQFLSVVHTNIESFGRNWEHKEGQMRHYPIDDIPRLVNNPNFVLGGIILRGGEANLVVAYVREKGLERIAEFPFVRNA